MKFFFHTFPSSTEAYSRSSSIHGAERLQKFEIDFSICLKLLRFQFLKRNSLSQAMTIVMPKRRDSYLIFHFSYPRSEWESRRLTSWKGRARGRLASLNGACVLINFTFHFFFLLPGVYKERTCARACTSESKIQRDKFWCHKIKVDCLGHIFLKKIFII